MKIKIAFDFDGICTDLSFISEQKINEFDYLYAPFSISISKKREGIDQLVSIFGLFADLFIITSRPEEDKNLIKRWLSKNKLLKFFNGIICCGSISKSILMKYHRIILLIDDKTKHLDSLSKNQKGILWEKQTWLELSKEIFSFLISTSKASLKIQKKLILSDVNYLSDLGASPVFILVFGDNTRVKLRVCLNKKVKKRILKFLSITSKNNYKYVSRLITSNGLAILKTFTDGAIISCLNNNEREFYILKAGSALAELHAIKINKSISSFKFDLNEKIESLLIFSADNYNMIVTPKNEVSFIDLEACNSGSRWIDFCWSENLLCETEEERKAFSEGYYKVYKGNKPTHEEKKLAELNYKLWLTCQLQNSKYFHADNADKIKIIDDTFIIIWN